MIERSLNTEQPLFEGFKQLPNNSHDQDRDWSDGVQFLHDCMWTTPTLIQMITSKWR